MSNLSPRFSMLLDGAWVDVSDDVRANNISIVRGRDSETDKLKPSTVKFSLDNTNLKYSNRNPLSPYYGKLKRNTPVKVTMSSGWGALNNPTSTVPAGAYASGDLDVRVQRVVTQSAGVTASSSWSLIAAPNGMSLSWRSSTILKTATQLIAIPAGHNAYRATLDGNNGSGGYTVTFYTSASWGGPWTQLGSPITVAGVAPIDPAVGAISVTGTPTYQAAHFEMRAGINGAVLMSPDFTTQPIGTTSFSDAQANTWTATLGIGPGGFPRFYGEVASWEPVWNESHSDQKVVVTAAGVTRRLNQSSGNVLSSMQWMTEVEGSYAPTVEFYWPLEQVGPDYVSNSVVGKAPAVIRSSKALSKVASKGALNGWLPNVVSLFANDSISALVSQNRTFSTAEQGIGFNVMVAGTQGQVFVAEIDCYTVTWVITLDFDANNMRVQNNAGYNSVNSLPLVDMDSGAPLMLEFDWRRAASASTSKFNVTLFDVERDVTTGWSAPSLTYPVSSVRAVTLYSQATNTSALSVGHLIVNYFTSVYGTYAVEPAAAGFPGQSDSTRMGVITALEPGLTLISATAFSSEKMGRLYPGTFLDQIEAIESLRPAMWVESPTGTTLKLCPLTTSVSSTTVDLDYSLHQVAAPFEPAEDDRFTKNDITVKTEDGGEVKLSKATGSMSTQTPETGGVGRYLLSETISADNETYAAVKAGWLLERGTFEGPRFPSVTIDLNAPSISSSKRGELMLLEPGLDYIQVNNLQEIGLYEPVLLRVVGSEERIGPGTHTLTFNCVPGEQSVNRFLIAPATGADLIDSDASTLTSGISSSATSLSVTTVADKWAYSSNFDIHVGGERMTVTAISGSSSPFTFTVTRSVNGVTKAHSAGSAVRLADRNYVGY